MTDFRALCAELTAALEFELGLFQPGHSDLLDRARAALTEPEPQGPTDEELLQVAASSIAPYENCGIAIGEYEAETEHALEAYGSELIAFARTVLARYARPAIEPVPGAEAIAAELEGQG